MLFLKQDKICPFCFKAVRKNKRLAKGNDIQCEYIGCEENDRCDKLFPKEMEKADFFPVVVVGAKGAGKSHFLGVALHELMSKDFEGKYGVVVNYCSDKHTGSRLRVYENTLYTKKELLTQTDSVRTNPDIRLPMLFNLKFKRPPNGKKNLVLGFFDVAGEDFSAYEKNNLLSDYPVLSYAKAFILLLDPLQIPKVKDILSKADRSFDQSLLLEVAGTDTLASDVLQRLRVALGGKFNNISLAVCFSKIDAICGFNDMPSEDSPIYSEDTHIGDKSGKKPRVDINSLNLIDGEIREWLKEMDCANFVYQADIFKNMNCFFGISSLGSGIKILGKNNLKSPPEPIKVLDPILWLLWDYGYIDGENIK